MKPLRLKFKGINSFSDETEIDFEKLIKNGIFGIFGDTGSGKSSILDCISFALYGKVERSKEKLDIINYNSDEARAQFLFEANGDGGRKRYLVTRSVKKKSGVHKATLYEGDLCTADNPSTVNKRICEILGVNSEDFSKCIALPQGEFSQFVKSNPSERIALIERLFSLSRYGDKLKDKIRAREIDANTEYNYYLAKTETYENYSKEGQKDIDEELNALKKTQTELQAECENSEKLLSSLRAIGENAAELEKLKAELICLESKKAQMQALHRSLDAVPKYKTLCEAEEEIKEKESKLEALKESANKLKCEKTSAEERVKELAKKLKDGDYDKRLADLIKKDAEEEALFGKIQKSEDISKLLDSRRKKFKELTENGEKLKKECESTKRKIETLENKLKNTQGQDLLTIIQTDFKGAYLKGEYANTLDYYLNLKDELCAFPEKSGLSDFINREVDEKIADYKQRVSIISDFTEDKAKQKLKNFVKSGEEREKLALDLSDCKTALAKAEADFRLNEREKEIVLRDGEKERRELDEIKSELSKVFGENCSDYKKANSLLKNKITALNNEKDELTKKADEAKRLSAELSASFAAAEAEQKSTASDIEAKNAKLLKLLSEWGYADAESLKKLFDGIDCTNAEKQLKEFDESYIFTTSKIAELEKAEGVKTFKPEQLTKAEETYKDLTNKLSCCGEQIAVTNQKLKDYGVKLSEKQDLLKSLAKSEKQRDLICQLKDLTKGNKFMEFIADEYLSDIAFIASSTLLNLTDGRYFLKYEGTFFVGDNYNCGLPRGVNTLSGGETFLVSLSLALALSKTICLSLKSVEFFFLDEGFGTLDSSLVDTVMTALEKLKGEHFTIGVISHVEELKHRINNKIIVEKSSEIHGSTVSASY